MTPIQILPVVVMVESFAASIVLLVSKQWGSAVYWFAAGLLNFAVIFLIKRFG